MSSAELSEPKEVVTYGIADGIPFESVISVPTSTCAPIPTGTIRSAWSLMCWMKERRPLSEVEQSAAGAGLPSVAITTTVAPPFALER